MDWQRAAETGDFTTLTGLSSLVDEATGERPLHFAAKGGRVPAIEYLAQNKASINTPDKFGRTPLYNAVFHRHYEAVELLLKENASPHPACQCGTTMVSKAAENGDMKILDLLLEKGASWKTQNQDGESPCDLALRNGHFVVWNKLKYYETDRLQSFMDAVKIADTDTMKNLVLFGGVDPLERTFTDSSALDIAVQKGQREAVYFLLHNREITQVTTEKRAQATDNQGRTALHWAARKGNEAIIQLLLDAGARPDVRDKYEKTPLDNAQARHHKRAAELLRR